MSNPPHPPRKSEVGTFVPKLFFHKQNELAYQVLKGLFCSRYRRLVAAVQDVHRRGEEHLRLATNYQHQERQQPQLQHQR